MQRRNINETYNLIVGKVGIAHNHCNELVVPLQEKSSSRRLINLAVRVFDDGVGPYRVLHDDSDCYNPRLCMSILRLINICFYSSLRDLNINLV